MAIIKVKLSAILGERRIKQSALVEMTGLSSLTINKLYHENVESIRFETLIRLCKALDCQVSDLLEYIPE